MNRSRHEDEEHEDEEIDRMFREAEAMIAEGQTVEQICRQINFRETTHDDPRESYELSKMDQVEPPEDPEAQNGRLRKLAANLRRAMAAVKDALSG